MSETKKFVVRCRAIIIHEGKLLLVRHSPKADFVALPGGHLEWEEDVIDCIRREVIEELGVEPEIGRLLYVNTYIDGGHTQSTEFFFEIKNTHAYVDFEKLERSHSHELCEIVWVSPEDDIKILPLKIGKDFREGKMLADVPRYIKEFAK